MVTTRKCGTCGAALPEGAPTGQCPECLLQLGLDAAADDGANSMRGPRLPLLRYFGDYELLEEIARGGIAWSIRRGKCDHTLKLWDTAEGIELGTLYGHRAQVTGVTFSKDGRRIYSTGGDGDIRVWEAPPLAEIDSITKSTAIQSRPVRSNELK